MFFDPFDWMVSVTSGPVIRGCLSLIKNGVKKKKTNKK